MIKKSMTSVIAMTFGLLLPALSVAATKEVPNTFPQFQPILSDSVLQITESNGKLRDKSKPGMNGKFENAVYDEFYVNVANGKPALVFSATGNKMRSELRVKENFRTDLPTTYYHLNATLQPINPLESIKNSTLKQNEITYLQVHNKGINSQGEGAIPHPLLRVVWKQDNHYWAIVKNNAWICKGAEAGDNVNKPGCKGEAYTSYDLGEAKTKGGTAFELILGNKTLTVKVDGKTKVTHDISYWAPLLSYYKAGIYNQLTDGTTQVDFYGLSYSVKK